MVSHNYAWSRYQWSPDPRDLPLPPSDWISYPNNNLRVYNDSCHSTTMTETKANTFLSSIDVLVKHHDISEVIHNIRSRSNSGIQFNQQIRRIRKLSVTFPEKVASLPTKVICSMTDKEWREGTQAEVQWRTCIEEKLPKKRIVDPKLKSIIQCPKCKARKATYFQLQICSGDESMTVFAQCLVCDWHWTQ